MGAINLPHWRDKQLRASPYYPLFATVDAMPLATRLRHFAAWLQADDAAAAAVVAHHYLLMRMDRWQRGSGKAIDTLERRLLSYARRHLRRLLRAVAVPPSMPALHTALTIVTETSMSEADYQLISALTRRADLRRLHGRCLEVMCALLPFIWIPEAEADALARRIARARPFVQWDDRALRGYACLHSPAPAQALVAHIMNARGDALSSAMALQTFLRTGAIACRSTLQDLAPALIARLESATVPEEMRDAMRAQLRQIRQHLEAQRVFCADLDAVSAGEMDWPTLAGNYRYSIHGGEDLEHALIQRLDDPQASADSKQSILRFVRDGAHPECRWAIGGWLLERSAQGGEGAEWVALVEATWPDWRSHLADPRNRPIGHWYRKY